MDHYISDFLYSIWKYTHERFAPLDRDPCIPQAAPCSGPGIGWGGVNPLCVNLYIGYGMLDVYPCTTTDFLTSQNTTRFSFDECILNLWTFYFFRNARLWQERSYSGIAYVTYLPSSVHSSWNVHVCIYIYIYPYMFFFVLYMTAPICM